MCQYISATQTVLVFKVMTKSEELKTKKLFEPDLFEQIKKRDNRASLAWKLASFGSQTNVEAYLKSIELIANDLFIEEKLFKDLKTDLNSLNDGCFRGALAEIIGRYSLSMFFNKVTKDPYIGLETPDYYCHDQTPLFGPHTVGRFNPRFSPDKIQQTPRDSK